MPAVYVERGQGLRQGPDVVDVLLATQLVLIERGRVEIDASSVGMQKVYLTCKYRGGVRRGQLAEVSDSAQGELYKGKIVGFSYTARDNAILLNVTLVRPTP